MPDMEARSLVYAASTASASLGDLPSFNSTGDIFILGDMGFLTMPFMSGKGTTSTAEISRGNYGTSIAEFIETTMREPSTIGYIPTTMRSREAIETTGLKRKLVGVEGRLHLQSVVYGLARVKE